MSLQESIRRILKEEINEIYSKPSEKMNKLIERWLNKLFSGAKMYHKETWKTRHDFEWCHHGLEIASVTLFFNEDKNIYDDKRPTSKRNFESGELSIPKSLIDDLVNYVPIRRNYLRYKIEEWFDVAKYPQIKFVSTKITKSVKSEDGFIIVGNLKIKGAVKETKIPVIYSKSGDGAKFSGSFNVKRSDFKVGHKGDVVPDIMKIDFVVPVIKK